MKPLRQISFSPSLSDWQDAARRALVQNLQPGEIFWQEKELDQPSLDLFAEAEWSKKPQLPSIKVPSDFLRLASRVSCHRNPERWALLYRVLWRLVHGERHLLEVSVDRDVFSLRKMEKAVSHDLHKMRAFVRFREVVHESKVCYVAWFEPEHHIVEENAPFFVDRFASLNWSILTPDRCAHWNGKNLQFSPGAIRSENPAHDKIESLWIRYYSSIFNPARVKVGMMQSEMPVRYWKNLPEAAAISNLIREAPGRTQSMISNSHAKASGTDGMQ